MLDVACSSLLLSPHRIRAGLCSTYVAASQLCPAQGNSSGSNFCMSFLLTLFLKTGRRKLAHHGPPHQNSSKINDACGTRRSCSVLQNASMYGGFWNWSHAVPACYREMSPADGKRNRLAFEAELLGVGGGTCVCLFTVTWKHVNAYTYIFCH